jgi:hypothetical protein
VSRERVASSKRKEKPAILNEFVDTTGYKRKYALRIFNRRETKDVIIHTKDWTVKLKPSQKRPANHKTTRRVVLPDVLPSCFAR